MANFLRALGVLFNVGVLLYAVGSLHHAMLEGEPSASQVFILVGSMLGLYASVCPPKPEG